jgi:hypothetical protein
VSQSALNLFSGKAVLAGTLGDGSKHIPTHLSARCALEDGGEYQCKDMSSDHGVNFKLGLVFGSTGHQSYRRMIRFNHCPFFLDHVSSYENLLDLLDFVVDKQTYSFVVERPFSHTNSSSFFELFLSSAITFFFLLPND